jgi:polar amino acid transport system substrate-binding protein
MQRFILFVSFKATKALAQLRLFSSILLALCFSFPVTAQQEVLQIGSRAQVIPFADPQAYQLMNQAAEKMGIKISYYYFPAGRSIELAARGELDGEIYRHQVVESTYPELIRVDEPIAQLEYWVWVPQQDVCMVDKAALSNYKPIGILSVPFFKKHVYPFSKVGFEQVRCPEQLFGMLALDRADYTVNDYKIMSYQNTQLKNKLKPCLDAPLFKQPVYLYLHNSKRHLVKEFSQVLRELKVK